MKITVHPTLALLLLLTLVLPLGGCASLGKYDGNQVTPESAVISNPPIFEDTGGTEHAGQFALMALFAKAAYRNDIADPKVRAEHACDYLVHPEHRDVLLDMPRDANGGGWARWTQTGACYSENGLFFETYVHSNEKGVIDEAVIGIRGTENTTLYEARHDWGANLSGALPFAGAEYERAARHIMPVIDQLAQTQGANGTPIKKIFLSGHSLGGGIAQYIAYRSPKVTAAFTFNPSPVTQWYQMSDEEKKRDPTIYRIYMNKEVLSYVREVTSRFNIRRYHRTDYQFFFVDGGAIDTHDMSHLACQFAARVPQCGAEHNYSYASATATLNSPTLCPNEVRKHIPARLLDRAAAQLTPPCKQNAATSKITNAISYSGCRHENN